MEEMELVNNIAKKIREENRKHRRQERVVALLNANASLERAKRLTDITQYDGDKSLHVCMVDPYAIGLDKREIEALTGGFPSVKEAIQWLKIHSRSRVVRIGGPHKDKPYMSDKRALGDKLNKWNGWKVDLINAQVWNSRGREASYNATKGGYINVNGTGLHRLVMMAYLVVRGRSEPKYVRMCQELVKDTSPYQVHHIFSAHKGDRGFNGIRSIVLERVEKGRPNHHQPHNNIGRKVKKYLRNY